MSPLAIFLGECLTLLCGIGVLPPRHVSRGLVSPVLTLDTRLQLRKIPRGPSGHATDFPVLSQVMIPEG